MRLGLLSTSYPSRGDRTSGAFVEGFAEGMIARGHTVHVLAPRPMDDATPRTMPGLDVTFVDYAPRPLRRTFHGAGVLDNLRATPRAWPGLATFPLALAHAARTHVRDWDAVVSHFLLPCALVAGLVRSGRPHLAIAHSADLHLLSELPGRRALARRIEAGASALWFVSSRGEEAFTRALGRPPQRAVHVAPMGVAAPPRATRAPSRTLRVLFLGRLVHVKGADVLIDALAGVEGVTLDVVGGGPLRGALEARATAAGIDATFHGARTDDAKWAHVAEADVVVVPSRRLEDGRTEGAPVVIVEAMSMGVPVVASAVGGIPELVGDAASLVPDEDVLALRDALRALRDDLALREALATRGTARARRFTWTTLCAEAEALLRAR